MLEPEKNPIPSYLVDPPPLLRWVLSRLVISRQLTPAALEKRRTKAEARRRRTGSPHVVEYFHQLDDPYSHLAVQVLSKLAAHYEVVLKFHLIRATGGASQPEFDKLTVWARRDAELIAPHYGLSFPEHAGTVVSPELVTLAGRAMARIDVRTGGALERAAAVSRAQWSGDETELRSSVEAFATEAELEAALDAGSARLAKLGHYSGATFFYGDEWFWGVDRIFHLERRLRDLGACRAPDEPLICPRPQVDLSGVNASGLRLDFYPSLNSPYTAIVFDRTIALKEACGIAFNHKPVLPMLMRGLPVPPKKVRYILFDTKREADFEGVSFGDIMFPVGTPVRWAYALLPWARSQGKDEALMSALLEHAYTRGVGLHRKAGMKKAVEAAGLDWARAEKLLDDESWKPLVEANQDEMIDGLGLWGVPSFCLSGPSGEDDLAVWGQDRLWLIATEIKRRCASA